MKITKIKYILVLESADSEASLMEDIPNINFESQEKVQKIKKILDADLIDNSQLKYLIKQRDYPPKKNIQEPIKNLYYSEIFAGFQKKYPYQ